MLHLAALLLAVLSSVPTLGRGARVEADRVTKVEHVRPLPVAPGEKPEHEALGTESYAYRKDGELCAPYPGSRACIMTAASSTSLCGET